VSVIGQIVRCLKADKLLQCRDCPLNAIALATSTTGVDIHQNKHSDLSVYGMAHQKNAKVMGGINDASQV
jgi:hypothetical protein